MRSLRGDPAGRLVGIGVFVLSVAPVSNRQLQHVCSSRRHSFVLGIECVLMSACIIVHMCTFMVCLYVHAYFIVCLYTVYTYVYTSVSMCIHVCVCMSVYIWALFKLTECLIPARVGVFLFRLMQSGEVSASTAAGYQ